MSETAKFIPGLDLCQQFYQECVEPVLQSKFPNLVYSAALIGSGSEVLGFDTEMSSDHHWGPRVMLFLSQSDEQALTPAMESTFRTALPLRFRGYSTSYSDPDGHGAQLLDYSDRGESSGVNHRVEIKSVRTFLMEYLGYDIQQPLTAADWLSFPEQKLRTIVSGRVFHDGVGLEMVRKQFNYYPHDLWLYNLASCWSRIEQDEHLVGRAAFVGDEIGSSIIAARLVRDLMRVCFLIERQYAPYSKWFGTAFHKLGCAPMLEPDLFAVLGASQWPVRERHLVNLYELIAPMQNNLALTPALPVKATDFFDRPFKVISKGEFSSALKAAIADPDVRRIASRPLGSQTEGVLPDGSTHLGEQSCKKSW
jgi:hypothetical protein